MDVPWFFRCKNPHGFHWTGPRQVPAVPDLGEFHQVLHRLAEQLGVHVLLGASRHVIPQRRMFTKGFHHGISPWVIPPMGFVRPRFADVEWDLPSTNGDVSWGYQEKQWNFHGIQFGGAPVL